MNNTEALPGWRGQVMLARSVGGTEAAAEAAGSKVTRLHHSCQDVDIAPYLPDHHFKTNMALTNTSTTTWIPIWEVQSSVTNSVHLEDLDVYTP